MIYLNVLGKIDGFTIVQWPANDAPHKFLHTALRAGLNINAGNIVMAMIWQRIFSKYKTLHLKHVLEWEQLELSAAIAMILSDAYQKKTFQTLFARGMPATAEYVLDALKNNDSTALAHVLRVGKARQQVGRYHRTANVSHYARSDRRPS